MRALAIASLFVTNLAATAAADVALPPGAPDGVRYAADQVAAVTKADVTVELGGAGLPAGLSLRGTEAFAISPAGRGWKVSANAASGLMYGLLDLRDRIESGKPPAAAVVSSPALRLRGDTVDFPFYLGVNLYEGRWAHARSVENKTDSWWLDKGHWVWRLKRCAEYRINALLISHPHPFPALIDLPEMPEAAYFPPEHLARLREHFRWILDQAEQYGVRVYFLTWNIWVSPGFARAHNVAQEGADSDLVRAYTRSCYRRLFETYPKLAGIMTMAGEAPPACTDFVRDAIVGGLNQLATPPELLFWTWCSYPEDAKPIFAAYKGRPSIVHYLQYEQLFRPQADPRIKRTSDALGGIPVVTLGGLGTATGWYYWSDPYYIRDIMADLPKQNGEGCFFQGLDSFEFVTPKWLGWEGLARYWWDPKRPREDAHWQSRVVRRTGVREAGDDFLQASVSASAVTTRMLALLHRQTDHFMPQFGLPLTHYLGLPTLSTYVFENHERIDEQGRLSPRLGLTWPNPDWGEKVIGIVDFAAGKTGGTTPVQIANELERFGRDVLTRVARMRLLGAKATDGPAKWAKCMDQMEMNGHLGVHIAELSVKVYPGVDFVTYRPAIGRPWPWTHLQIWNLDQWRHHSFADSAAQFHREVDWVTEELKASYAHPLLPFEDDLAPKPPGAKRILQWDFEGAVPNGLKVQSFPPSAVASIATGGAPPPSQGARLDADHTGDGFWFPLVTDPAALPLEIGRAYWVSLDYRILRDAEKLGDWLTAGARTTEGGWQKDVGTRYMGGQAGTRGRITLHFTPHTWRDFYVYVSIHGPARVQFDNLEVWAGEAKP